jgi:hypothetical protein
MALNKFILAPDIQEKRAFEYFVVRLRRRDRHGIRGIKDGIPDDQRSSNKDDEGDGQSCEKGYPRFYPGGEMRSRGGMSHPAVGFSGHCPAPAPFEADRGKLYFDFRLVSRAGE